MKTIIYILLGVLSITKVFAQEEKKLVSFCENFSYGELQSGLDDFKKSSTDKIEFEWHIKLEREVVNGYFEQIIEFKKNVQNDSNVNMYSVDKCTIKLIKTKAGEISYYQVNKYYNVQANGEWIKTEKVLAENLHSSIEQLKLEFQKVYGSSLNFGELFETEIVFGKNCGFGGSNPAYRIKLNELVEKKDTTTLATWLKSATVEIQLYAIDGILTLIDSGIQFDKTTLELISIIANKGGNAYTCSGCIHRHLPIVEVVDRIKKGHNKM